MWPLLPQRLSMLYSGLKLTKSKFCKIGHRKISHGKNVREIWKIFKLSVCRQNFSLGVGFCVVFLNEMYQSIIMTVKVTLMCLSVRYPGHIMFDIPLIYRSLSSHWSSMVRRKWNNRTKSRFCENPTLKWSKGASWETTEIANFGLASRRVTER